MFDYEHEELDRHCAAVTLLLNRRNSAEFLLVANEDGSIRFECSDIIPADTGRSVRRDILETLKGWIETLEGRDD